MTPAPDDPSVPAAQPGQHLSVGPFVPQYGPQQQVLFPQPWQTPGYLAAEFHSDLRALRDSLAGMSSKLDGIRDSSDRIMDHESRLRALESRRWPIQVVTVVIAGLAAAAAVVALFLKK
ncbi:hypothetical protein [Streptomyces sp. NBC_00091]|uniref:hypothetical protein n=1 Tax=Streptomyces sp. NBC_00091 TaxID=2975648 RepID=UPI00225A1B56|nr:hypothetical protein [Streptomyces sp. NBC_00091]MCX5379000.1 hypothetical protein [Streptomyces sp. NBC_00091]